MKNFKKILLTMAMTMALGISAFAASGFEFILNVPLGVGIGIPSSLYKEMGYDKSGVGFDGGVAAQLGYMFQVTGGFGISVLGELGYHHSTYALSAKEGENSMSMSYGFDSFQIGLLPKFNIGAFAIGIGGGVKIPIAAQMSYKVKYGGQEEKGKEKVDVASFLKTPVIGYFKATFDYSIFFTDRLAFNIGLYLGGDIAKQEVSIGDVTAKSTTSSFDVGVELGLKFGPRA